MTTTPSKIEQPLTQGINSTVKEQNKDVKESSDFEQYHEFIKVIFKEFTDKSIKFENTEILESLQEEIAYITGLIQRIDSLILEDIELIKSTSNRMKDPSFQKIDKVSKLKIQQRSEKSKLRIRRLKSLAQSLRFAFNSLLQERPNIILARQIRIQTRREIIKYESFNSFLENGWSDFIDLPPIVKLIFGTFLAFFFSIVGVGLLSRFTIFNENLLNNPTDQKRIEAIRTKLEDLLIQKAQLVSDLKQKAPQELKKVDTILVDDFLKIVDIKIGNSIRELTFFESRRIKNLSRYV
jgi:hypothetical protein